MGDRKLLTGVGVDGSTVDEQVRGPARWAIIAGTVAGIALVIHQLFNCSSAASS